MSWQIFDVKRRDSRFGPFAITDGGSQLCSEVVLLQRSAAGETRAVLGFLVGTEYVPIEKVPGWTGETEQSKYTVLTEAAPR
ncbi:hypothetical protein [Gordonia rubripertincta]|uniref:hypothetical protein n=1 Tax=Gordonia rubripertincta TaxID=36822 RepID=UPI0015F7BDB1|nr:hypothetical protein [Gordonia rubripertincta]QMU22896.1 hypothetical protein H3V45_10700 [Gordonia rubripertincta]